MLPHFHCVRYVSFLFLGFHNIHPAGCWLNNNTFKSTNSLKTFHFKSILLEHTHRSIISLCISSSCLSTLSNSTLTSAIPGSKSGLATKWRRFEQVPNQSPAVSLQVPLQFLALKSPLKAARHNHQHSPPPPSFIIFTFQHHLHWALISDQM